MKEQIKYTMPKPLCPIGIQNAKPIPRALPESVGIPSSIISAFLNEALNDNALELHGITVLKDGKYVTWNYEYYKSILARASFCASLPVW